MAFFLDAILLAPVKGLVWIAEQIQEQAEKERMDEEGVKRKLTELYMLLETGQISEEEFERQEEELVARLEEIEAYHKNRGSL
ncbi:MAG: gas vesicle protein GvpG [Nitrospinae bacterium]|nr:gas vesicle protein GvpG [Nitrospinota bacterium]